MYSGSLIRMKTIGATTENSAFHKKVLTTKRTIVVDRDIGWTLKSVIC
jgi:hypothetical protein